jgi:hypothetical protein
LIVPLKSCAVRDLHYNWSKPQRLNRTGNYQRVSHCDPERLSHRRATDLLDQWPWLSHAKFGARTSLRTSIGKCADCVPRHWRDPARKQIAVRLEPSPT